jgi:hypothetical protein
MLCSKAISLFANSGNRLSKDTEKAKKTKSPVLEMVIFPRDAALVTKTSPGTRRRTTASELYLP